MVIAVEGSREGSPGERLSVCENRRHGSYTRINVRFGSKAEKLDLSIRCPLCPRERTLSDTTGVSALCQKRTYAPQQKHRYSFTWSARASSAAERPCRAYQLRVHFRHEIDVGQFLDRKRRVIPIRGRRLTDHRFNRNSAVLH